MATWRIVPKKRSQGPYFVLQKGRGAERLGLALGYMDRDSAEVALSTIQREEDAQSVGRVLRLYQQDRDQAVRYLLEDPEVIRRIGQGEPDYGSMKLEDYFESCYRPWRIETRPRSWPSEERHWKLLVTSIGDTPLRRVDEFVLANHLDQLRVTRGARKGEPASGNTKRLQRAALQALLKRAYRLQHIRKLPNLAVFRIDGGTKAIREKPDPLSLSELEALMQVSEPKFCAMWAVGAGQGLRPSELSGLSWESVDFEAKVLRVEGTKTRESAATVPMTPLAARELRRWWERCDRPSTGLVFPARSGARYRDQGWKKALTTAARLAGIDRHIYPYLLRDSFATIAWSVGMDMDVTRRIGRWTDDTMLREVYCRPRPSELAARVHAFDWGSETAGGET